MIKQATKKEVMILAKLAIRLWNNHKLSELEVDFTKIINDNESVCFIKYIDNIPIGFAQCQLRHDYVEGTKTSPVGYLEAIYIQKEYRNNGFAKELLNYCEKWAKEKGTNEFASDCELNNLDSLNFHIAMGFEETNRIICLKKII